MRLITRGGYDWTTRYPWITEAARKGPFSHRSVPKLTFGRGANTRRGPQRSTAASTRASGCRQIGRAFNNKFNPVIWNKPGSALSDSLLPENEEMPPKHPNRETTSPMRLDDGPDVSPQGAGPS